MGRPHPIRRPLLRYGFAPDATWHFTLNRLWLDILPAAAAIIAGLTMMGAARRVSGTAGSWLALIAGAWLLVGPSVSMFWQHPEAGVLISGIGAPLGGPNLAAVEMIGFFYGTGALIAVLAAFTTGRFIPGPSADLPAAENARELRAQRLGSRPMSRPAAHEPVDAPSRQPAHR